MKRFNDTKIVLLFLAFVVTLLLTAATANADFTFGEPVNIQSTFPITDPATEWITCFSADGLEVYFEAVNRPGGYGLSDIWVCKRASLEDAWGPLENLGPLVNGPSWDKNAFISADGLELYFHSSRPGGYGGVVDLYVTRRATRTSPWELPTNLGPKVNGPSDEALPTLSPDGLELYFMSIQPGGYGSWDLYVSTRATTNDPWGDPVNVGPAVNGPGQDCLAYLSPDGLLMFFQADRPGTSGACWDGYVARRASRSAPWQPAVDLGPIVNNRQMIGNGPIVTADGSALYILRTAADYTTLTWKAPILPIVDFNGDGKVDRLDMGLLMLNWGTDKSLYDIGPTPLGDGIVDSKDLMVLAQYGAMLAGDVNYDGVVDFFDLVELAKNWLQQQP
jgi:hypothetical protein